MRRGLLERAARRLGSSASQPSRGCCAGSGEQLLLRDYIHRQLYAPGDGYFSRRAPPVAWLEPGLDFASLASRADYLRAVKAAYERLQVAWLTPSEILTPHYGRAVAAHILRQHRGRPEVASDGALRIIELGAGTGTLARDVLDAIRQADPGAYASCSYVSVEISPTLAQTQLARVGRQAGHAQRFAVELRDAADAGGWGPPDARPCVILGMEVLDNCAHDRVERAADGGWLQEQVALLDGGPRLVQAPLSDPLIQAVLAEAVSPELERAHAQQQGGRARGWLDWLLPADPGLSRQSPYSRCHAAFLPTKAAQLLDTLASARPRHRLLLGDFSRLPDVVIPGRNAPLVATTAGGRTLDHSSYLVPQGTADIFFPTDFALLQALHRRSCQRAGTRAASEVLSARAFVRRALGGGATRLRDGWDPLAEDYSNTAFLVASSSELQA